MERVLGARVERMWAGAEGDADNLGWNNNDAAVYQDGDDAGLNRLGGGAEIQSPLSATVGLRCRLDFHLEMPGRR